MSWAGVPKKENYMPLFAEEWNKVVDALDELYFGGPYTLKRDLIPTEDKKLDIGKPDRRFLNLYVHNLDVTGNVTGIPMPDAVVSLAYIYPPAREHITEAIDKSLLEQYVEEIKTDTEDIKMYVNQQLAKIESIESDLTNVKANLESFFISLSTPPVANLENEDTFLLDITKLPNPFMLVSGVLGITGLTLTHNSASGEIRLYWLLKDEDLLWVPAEVVKKVVRERMYNRSSLDDSLYIYTTNLSTDAKIFLRLISYGNASMTSPFEGPWRSPYGLTKLWEFKRFMEYSDFANDFYQYVKQYRSMLTFEPPEGDVGIASRYVDGKYVQYLVMAIRVLSLASDDSAPIIRFETGDGTNLYSVELDTVAGDTSKLKIMDINSGAETTFENKGEWLIIIVDLLNFWVFVYDSMKQFKTQLGLTPASTTSKYYEISIYQYNNLEIKTGEYISNIVYVDWLGIY